MVRVIDKLSMEISVKTRERVVFVENGVSIIKEVYDVFFTRKLHYYIAKIRRG